MLGAFGEASEGVHHLVERLAEARLDLAETQPHQRGPTRSRSAEKAGLVAYVRRSLSLACVREQAQVLLGRLRLLGDGAGEAARRRARAAQLEVEAARPLASYREEASDVWALGCLMCNCLCQNIF